MAYYAGYRNGKTNYYQDSNHGWYNDRSYQAWDKQCKYQHYDSWNGKTDYELLKEAKNQTRNLEATVLHLLAD